MTGPKLDQTGREETRSRSSAKPSQRYKPPLAPARGRSPAQECSRGVQTPEGTTRWENSNAKIAPIALDLIKKSAESSRFQYDDGDTARPSRGPYRPRISDPFPVECATVRIGNGRLVSIREMVKIGQWGGQCAFCRPCFRPCRLRTVPSNGVPWIEPSSEIARRNGESLQLWDAVENLYAAGPQTHWRASNLGLKYDQRGRTFLILPHQVGTRAAS